MDTPIQVDLGRIAQDLQIRRVQVESVVQLLDEGNTVPFITRYRKERTGNLNEMAIREIQVRVGRLRELAERKETILKSVEAQGKLTDELRAAIKAADNPKRLEDLYLPFKPKKKTKASEARDKGLEPLALAIWSRDESLTDLIAAATPLLNPEKELDAPEKVLEGVGHILAEMTSELAAVRDAVRRVVWRTGKIVTTKADNVPEGEGLEYRDYFNYSEPASHIPPHRVLAINRGDKEGPLKVRLEVSRPDLESALLGPLALEGHPHADFLNKVALDALDRLLMPSMEREVRRDLTELAERHAVDVFARNLRSLLLQPPILKQTVMAIDPGFRTGCKIAVLDGNGNLLDHAVIHPHPPQNRRHEAKLALKDLVGKYNVGVVAVGNGTACRETEELIAEIIAEGTQFHQSGAAPAAPTAAVAEAPAPPQAAPEPAAAEAPAPAQAAHEAAVAEVPAPPQAAPAAATALTGEAAAEPPSSETHAEPAAETPAPPAPDRDEPSSVPSADGNSTHDNPGHSGAIMDESAAAESPIEHALPPISGGAPDSDAMSAPSSAPSAAPEPVGEVESPPPAVEPPHPAPEPAAEPCVEPVTAPHAVAGETPGSPAPSLAQIEGHAPAGAAPAATEAAPSAEAAPAPAPKSKPAPHRPPKPRPAPPPPAPHAADARLAQLAYAIVNEAGASVYSTSQVGREEFPEFDATLRSGISIGRRLQDPLSELVKIEPQNIGVGLYQHDVNPKQLKESLESVIESCVNFVGVDLNNASVSLLRHVSGLNQLTARRVVEYRKEKGPFTSREQLKEVEGIGPATFTQAAGFLKILDGSNPLDRTWVHPESYEVATRALEKLGFAPDVILHRSQLPALHQKMNEADLPALARELQVGEPTLHDIFEALARPERDPRDDLPKPIFKKGVLKLEDLSAGMELKGTVLNVVDFGAFVDIGLKDSGLVHISQLANRYIKSPHDVVSVGDVVTVWVMSVDQERKRVSLTMVKPGTERPRGQGGGRRPQGEGREGGERRGGGQRPPRREGGGGPRREPAASAAPGGAPAGPAQGEAPRRSERPLAPAGRGADAPPGGGGRPGGGGPPHPRGPGGPGRGGGRPHQGQGGPGRTERTHAQRPPSRPTKPAPPPPPLSKDALSGTVPLRTFGQLKQLWQARTTEGPAETEPHTGGPAEHQVHLASETPPPTSASVSAPPETPPEPAQVAPSPEATTETATVSPPPPSPAAEPEPGGSEPAQ